MNPILIIGVEHHNIYGVLKAFNKQGLCDYVYLLLVGTKSRYIHVSRYIESERISYAQTDSSLISTMNNMNFTQKVVVVCCSDASISYLDTHRAELKDRYILPSASGLYCGISKLMNKPMQAQIASSFGLTCPDGCEYERGDDVPSDIHYPCIVKPVDSVVAGKSEMAVCYDKDTLAKVLLNSKCARFQIQKFINKKLEFQLIGCAVHCGSIVIIPGYTRIIRQPSNTNTGFLEYNPLDDTIDESTINSVKAMMSAIGYEGLFSVEFVQDDFGTNYFMEINMRNDGNAVCVTDAGCNLPYIWYAYASGLDWKTEAEKQVTHLFCMPIISDLVMVLKGKVSVFKWLQDLRITKSFMDYNRDDKCTFFRQLGFFALFLMKRLFGVR